MVIASSAPWWLALIGPAILLATAIYARFYHARISSKRATVEFIALLEANEPLAKARTTFAKSGSKGPDHLKSLLGESGKIQEEKLDEYAAINKYLNHCEAVAVFIKSKALDEDMCKDCYRSQYIQAWYRYQEFIKHARNVKVQPTLYEHLEALIKRWEQN